MKTKFEMTDFGFLNSYLAIEVIQGKTEIKICQKKLCIKGSGRVQYEGMQSSKNSNGMLVKIKPRR